MGSQAVNLMGRRQVVKAPGFDPGIRRFESSRPSHPLGFTHGLSRLSGRRRKIG